jgi:hypothetical protein
VHDHSSGTYHPLSALASATPPTIRCTKDPILDTLRSRESQQHAQMPEKGPEPLPKHISTTATAIGTE